MTLFARSGGLSSDIFADTIEGASQEEVDDDSDKTIVASEQTLVADSSSSTSTPDTIVATGDA